MTAAEKIWMSCNVHNHYNGLHTGIMANISDEGEVSCAFRDMWEEVHIKSRHNAVFFNVTHFRVKTKNTNILVIDPNDFYAFVLFKFGMKLTLKILKCCSNLTVHRPGRMTSSST